VLKAFTLLSADTIFSRIMLEPESIHGVGPYDQWCSLERQGILCSPSAPAQGHEMDFSGDQRVGSSSELLLYYCRKPAAAQRYLIHPCRLKPSRTIIPALPAHAPTILRLCSGVRKFFPQKSPSVHFPQMFFLRTEFSFEILNFSVSISALLCMQSNTITQ